MSNTFSRENKFQQTIFSLPSCMQAQCCLKAAGDKELQQLAPGLIARLVIFLEWLVALPPEIREGYYTEQFKRLREENTMPYVSVMEKLELQLRYGNLPEDLRCRVAEADQLELNLWAERILFADSIEAVLARRA